MQKSHYIKNGVLYSSKGKEVKPEFGNPSHIKAFKQAQFYANFWDKGLKVEVKTNDDEPNRPLYVKHKCPNCKESDLISDEVENIRQLDDETLYCENYRCHYVFKLQYREDISEVRMFDDDFMDQLNHYQSHQYSNYFKPVNPLD